MAAPAAAPLPQLQAAGSKLSRGQAQRACLAGSPSQAAQPALQLPRAEAAKAWVQGAARGEPKPLWLLLASPAQGSPWAS